MQTMELVDVEDVYPYEDHDVRMNPRDVSTKECQAYIAQLAEQFKHNRLNPGQPRVRPILYRDGGIYQIVDGECRYWAMRRIGTRKFYADVFDDLADAETARREAAKAMVETDCKRALTPEEMSRGVQTMLAVDVPEEEVAASARVDVERVRRARRGAAKVSDAAYDMTLDRLMAIAEFEGDEDAVAALRDCRQCEWERVYRELVDDRKARENREACVAALEAAGVRVAEEKPEGYLSSKWVYMPDDGSAECLAEYLEKAPEGAVAVVDERFVSIYHPAKSKEPSEEEIRHSEELAAFEVRYNRDRARMLSWLGARAKKPMAMRSTSALLAGCALANHGVAVFCQQAGADASGDRGPVAMALGFSEIGWPDLRKAEELAGIERWQPWRGSDGLAMYKELLAAMVADGYEASEQERAIADGAAAIEEGDEDGE